MWVIPILPFKITAFFCGCVSVYFFCVTKLCDSPMVYCIKNCIPVSFIQSGLSNVTVPNWKCLLCLCFGLVSSRNKTRERLDQIPVVSLMFNTVVRSSLAYLSTLELDKFLISIVNYLVFDHRLSVWMHLSEAELTQVKKCSKLTYL